MILSNRDYWFGTRIARLSTEKFAVMVSTAKAGLFQKQSTRFYMLDGAPDFAKRGPWVGEIQWAVQFNSATRLEFHEKVVRVLDKLGADTSLIDAIERIVQRTRATGHADAFHTPW